MDERTLNELLECSVCLDRLDTTSKVLPCQHTFCRRCLEEIVSTKHELRCPECRSLVEIKVEDLPSNILLIRLLEGIKTAGSGASGNSDFTSSSAISQKLQAASSTSRNVSNKISTSQPCAKALYNYDAKEPGDLSFKKGDVVLLRKQVDENWYHGELNGQFGFFPATYVQVLKSLPPQEIPKCTALYDFIIDDENEKDCLTFHKDEVVTVIRRIDEHWAEGKLNERIGIFPISFVDLNDSAKWLINNPPFPSSASSLRGNNQHKPLNSTVKNNLPHTSTNNSSVNNTESLTDNQGLLLLEGVAENDLQRPTGSNDLCNNVQSASNIRQNTQNSNHIRTTLGILVTTASQSLLSSSPSQPSSVVSTVGILNTLINPSIVISSRPSISAAPSSSLSHHTSLTTTSAPRPSPSLTSLSSAAANQHKRHSFTSIEQPGLSLVNAHQRHSLELTGNELVTAASLLTQSAPNESTNGAAATTSECLSVSTSAPVAVTSSSLINHVTGHSSAATSMTEVIDAAGDVAASKRPRRTTSGIFIALYNYKPQKDDEVELTKGAYYIVSEKCQDGWYKGTCLRSGFVGVFPGNYVQMVRLPASMKAAAVQRAAVLCPANTTQATSVASATPSTTGVTPLSALLTFDTKNRTSVNRTHSFPKTSPHHLELDVHGRLSSQGTVIKAPSRTITNVTQALSRCIASAAMSSPSSLKVAQTTNTQTGAMLSSSTHTTPSHMPNEEKSHVCVNPGAISHSPKTSRRHHHHHGHYHHSHHHYHGSSGKHSSGLSPRGHSSSSPVTVNSGAGSADSMARSSPTTSVMIENSLSTETGTATAQQSGPATATRTASSTSSKPSTSVTKSVVAGSSKSTSSSSKISGATSGIRTTTSGASGVSEKHEKPAKEKKERKERDKRNESILKRLASAGIPLKARKSKSPPPPEVTDRKEHRHSTHHRSGSEGSILEGAVAATIVPSPSTPNTSTSSHNRKSLDKPAKVKPLTRDRYRCIVPYPSQSDIELELKEGDVVYVHKKREDGWFKGTLQRTGKTGLFPCSFVNKF